MENLQTVFYPAPGRIQAEVTAVTVFVDRSRRYRLNIDVFTCDLGVDRLNQTTIKSHDSTTPLGYNFDYFERNWFSNRDGYIVFI